MDSKYFTVKTSDGEEIKMNIKVAMKFGLLKKMIEDIGLDLGTIPIMKVDANTFRKVIEWAKKHADSSATESELKKWDLEFTRDIEVRFEMYRLLRAADFLEACDLIDLLTEKVALELRGKTYLQIRELLGIHSDFAPGVVEEIIAKNPWAFE